MCSPTLFPESARFSVIRRGLDEVNLDNYYALHPLEKALVAHAVDIRKAEFGDARWCAHQALRALDRDTEIGRAHV